MKIGDLVRWTPLQPDVDDQPADIGIITDGPITITPENEDMYRATRGDLDFFVMFMGAPTHPAVWSSWCFDKELEVISESG